MCSTSIKCDISNNDTCCCAVPFGMRDSCQNAMKPPVQLGASFLCVGILVFAIAAVWHPKPRLGRAHPKGQFHDPVALLTQANHLSLLGKWYAAGPLYGEAEKRFRSIGDKDNETYARIGRIRSQATGLSLNGNPNSAHKEAECKAVRPAFFGSSVSTSEIAERIGLSTG
jgi:hypothetical protein